MEKLKDFEATYLGAIGDPRVPNNISLRDLLLNIPPQQSRGGFSNARIRGRSPLITPAIYPHTQGVGLSGTICKPHSEFPKLSTIRKRWPR